MNPCSLINCIESRFLPCDERLDTLHGVTAPSNEPVSVYSTNIDLMVLLQNHVYRYFIRQGQERGRLLHLHFMMLFYGKPVFFVEFECRTSAWNCFFSHLSVSLLEFFRIL